MDVLHEWIQNWVNINNKSSLLEQSLSDIWVCLPEIWSIILKMIEIMYDIQDIDKSPISVNFFHILMLIFVLNIIAL